MVKVKEQTKIIGHVKAELFKPGTDILVAVEEGDNVIGSKGADAITNGLDTGTIATFNYMAISAATTPDPAVRATTTVPGSMTPTITKFMSTVINPSVDNTTPTSKISWVFTFTAASGRTAIKQFGMETTGTGSGDCFNTYIFAVVKDNTNNDLKLTYTVSVAP